MLRVRGKLVRASVLDRPNRFTLLVEVEGSVKRAYLANPGRLAGLVDEGQEVLLLKRRRPGRMTDLDAFASKLDDVYVTLRSAMANDLFAACVRKRLLPGLEGYRIGGREIEIGGYGRIDFVLERGGERAFVEVKSCTHCEDGIAKFPDAPTERGRRHLERLIGLPGRRFVFFVVQRPDAQLFRPFWEVDPDFARLLEEASNEGVLVRALTTRFDLRTKIIYLSDPLLPVKLSGGY